MKEKMKDKTRQDKIKSSRENEETQLLKDMKDKCFLMFENLQIRQMN